MKCQLYEEGLGKSSGPNNGVIVQRVFGFRPVCSLQLETVPPTGKNRALEDI